MERGQFLSRLRSQMGAPPPNLAHPRPAAFVDVPPRYDVAPELPTAFLAGATAHGAHAREVGPEDDSLESLLGEIFDTHAVRTAACSDDPEVDGLARLLVGLGIEVVDARDRDALADVDLGVTGAVAGIAATGTVAVDAGRAGGRSVSLLPPIHLALVRRSALVPDPSAWWRGLPGRYPDGLPSQIVCITGPSKSADIEFTLTVGVHGPKHLWIGLLPD